jgi:hypothetical protein
MPAVFNHCVEVYSVMEKESETDAEGRVVWTGYTTKLFKRLGLAVPLYTSVTQHLKRMDCIRQLARGGGGSPSAWMLLQEPTTELYDSSPLYKKTTADDILGQQIRDQQKVINELSDRLDIVEAKVG